MAHVQPINRDELAEFAGFFRAVEGAMGFVPNSLLIMARNPKLVEAFTAMSAAIWDPSGNVDLKLKRLISHVASSRGRLPILHGSHGRQRGQARD